MILGAPPALVTEVAGAELLLRVMQNLFGNALKFTPADGWIRLGVEPQETRVRVTVRDNGQGVPPDYQQRIFEKIGEVKARAN